MAKRYVETQVIPTKQDFAKLMKARAAYEAAQGTPERDSWNKSHFSSTPWGIAWKVSSDPRAKSKDDKTAAALRFFIAAVVIGWVLFFYLLHTNRWAILW